MTISQNDNPYRIARRAANQGARVSVGDQAVLDKYTTGQSINTNQLLRCKKTVLISSLNVNTLNSDLKMGEITACALKEGIDVICVQEHRIYHDNTSIRHHHLGNGWMLLTSSAEKASNNATIRGVGFILSPKGYQSLNKIESINPRILIASFNGNPSTDIICCYSPTNVAEEDSVKEFYAELSELVKSIPKHNLVIIGGDFNGQIGKSESGNRSFHLSTNRNGEYLLDFSAECDLINLNLQYTKRSGKKWTFKYPSGDKGQLDYMLINKKWRNSALDCEAYNSFSTVNSDHRIVSSRIRLSLRMHKNKSRKTVNYDWKRLLLDESVKTAYAVEVRNRFDLLQVEETVESADTIYNNVMKAHVVAAEKHVPKKPKKKKLVLFESTDVETKRQEVKKAQTLASTRKTRSADLALRNAKKDLEDAYTRELRNYVNEKIDIISNAAENQQSRLAWETVNELSGRKNTPTGKLRADNPKQRVQKWKEHFQNLLGQPPVVRETKILPVIEQTLPINTNEFTKEELLKCIESFKNGKASGLDNIPIEVWKIDALTDALLDVCNRTFHGDKPEIWGKSGLKPLPKKGDLGLPENYRGISLNVIASKIYNKMLLQRIGPHIEPILRMNQNGFRPKRSTLAQILTLRRLIEGIRSKNLTAVLTFVDFSKAFDSIHRGKLMEIMKAYGIPTKIVRAVNTLYNNTQAQVLSPDGDTDFFSIQAGVLQGDTLAPLLFILALDYVMRIATINPEETGFTLTRRLSRRIPSNMITDTDFADDIALLSDNVEKAQLLLTRLELAAEIIGLHINEKKTEFISINQNAPEIKSANGKHLKKVDDFKYLGSWISSSEKDMATRIGMAWTAANKMEVIWKSRLNRSLKIQFFKSTVESVLLYGSECWTLTKSMENRLDGTYTKLLRKALNVSWRDRMRNTELYGQLPSITDVIRTRRLRFIGHVWRREEETLHKLLLWDPSHGRRSRGRPKKTFVDQICEDSDVPREYLARFMKDREEWRRIVNDVRVRSTR